MWGARKAVATANLTGLLGKKGGRLLRAGEGSSGQESGAPLEAALPRRGNWSLVTVQRGGLPLHPSLLHCAASSRQARTSCAAGGRWKPPPSCSRRLAGALGTRVPSRRLLLVLLPQH